MRNRFCQKMLSLLLSALMLAWGTVPAGVQHAHAGGDDSTHRPDDCRELAHQHHHDSHHHHPHAKHHEHATASDVSLLTELIVHLHIRWLGFEFSLPVAEDPVDGDDSGSTVPLAIVRAIGEISSPTQGGPAVDRVLLAVIGTPNVDVVLDLTPVSRLRLCTSIPLCESARFERSRVLLA